MKTECVQGCTFFFHGKTWQWYKKTNLSTHETPVKNHLEHKLIAHVKLSNVCKGCTYRGKKPRSSTLWIEFKDFSRAHLTRFPFVFVLPMPCATTRFIQNCDSQQDWDNFFFCLKYVYLQRGGPLAEAFLHTQNLARQGCHPFHEELAKSFQRRSL